MTGTTFDVKFCHPLVLLIKIGWKQVTALRSEEGRVTERGLRGVCRRGKWFCMRGMRCGADFGYELSIRARRKTTENLGRRTFVMHADLQQRVRLANTSSLAVNPPYI